MPRAIDRKHPAILLVEDEILIALDLTERLEERGYAVIGPAGRVADALALIEDAGSIAAGLLDINLAGEKSWPVARALQSRGAPYAFVTGYLSDHAAIPPDLATAYVCPKPLDDLLLDRALAALLGRR